MRLEPPTAGILANDPATAAVNITRCTHYVFTHELVDTQPRSGPPAVVILPVTGGDGPQLTSLEWWLGLGRWLLGLIGIYC